MAAGMLLLHEVIFSPAKIRSGQKIKLRELGVLSYDHTEASGDGGWDVFWTAANGSTIRTSSSRRSEDNAETFRLVFVGGPIEILEE